MPLALLTHPSSLAHQTPWGHPERPERMKALEVAFADERFALLDRREARRPDESILRLAHPARYIERIRAAGARAARETEPAPLDADTYMSAGSYEAALHAAGAAVEGVDLVMAGEAGAAFIAARPPGHHAEPEKPMGFCLFANAAIAALHALSAHGLKRAAVVDFDVHHGNGTQAVLQDDPRVAFASSHQSPLWPGTGAASETGAGNIFNPPLAPHTGSEGFRQAWEDRLLPAIAAHEPEILIISAGFDAHKADPLAELQLETEDFAWITHRLCDLAERACEGRIVSVLEGGYDLKSMAVSAAAHAQVLMERSR